MRYTVTATISFETTSPRPSSVAAKVEAIDIAVKEALRHSRPEVRLAPLIMPTPSGPLVIARCACGKTFTRAWTDTIKKYRGDLCNHYTKCPACGRSYYIKTY